ncbi:MarR family transcriptional regulator [Streptomyces sp. NPDC005917]|uniref:MarR family winged helix-turn-helix transcriptional regulator n=1 Tax=unclassified Streptomyces TaxID=2593676 RepID=UPI0033E9282D
MYQVLVIIGRAGKRALSMRAIAREQVLTASGATRLLDSMEAAGLVEWDEDAGDRSGRFVRLTREGTKTTVAASRCMWRTSRRFFPRPLLPEDRDRFAEDLRALVA